METSIHTIASNNLLILFAIVAITGILCSKLSERINIPDVVLFLIAGIIIGPSFFKFIDISSYQIENQLILTFGSAFILYLGGKEISLKVLKNVKVTVLLLSTLGVLVSAFIMKQIIGLSFEISSISALLAGAIIASTDPATLVPIFNSVKIKDKVKQTVISESAFNDATGAILTSAVITIILSGKFSFQENIYNLSIMIILGVIVGVITGILLLKLISDKPYGVLREFAPIVSVLSVIISYEVATKLGGSGYMACFIVGIINGNKKNFKIWLTQRSYDTDLNVVETLGTVCRMMIFIILGSQVNLQVLMKYLLPSLLVVVGLIFIARPISVLICTIFDKKAKWSRNEILFMMWVRETGVIPAALCGIITTMKIPGYEIISSIVFMTILITLIIQGSTTKYIAGKLGLLEEE
ncbi:cation:proton antiporter [Paraclostridium bifermentans]|uniref:cation:proton antiporter n=1 Tax=Paraclostridium bifermentans TaxID=1490 RepID=UPI00038CFB90|nr:cation:proton antiporter [Paraclostridium bifermentans]EQK37986.1 sodium/hydrogen exchanger family protein [[Clostridium] bifermentans ATCC 19299] [Paraclostridium bifermentans ATCC 19299]MCE9675171.1 cation:proton antiporter [Paraclostridium bifermentans]TQO59284.1 sodium:proton antiporter [Paraclostridium bifermentans]GKZ02663.1 sodium:proton antiporter [Paraclostridium bifermentans]GKZ08229.1 sodium:proton antiporter [Paraclostridium bifermentans]